MGSHLFIFQPMNWLGEGKVTFTASSGCLDFYTRWETLSYSEEVIIFRQLVEMKQQGESIYNVYAISNISKEAFDIELTNDILGTVCGKGFITDKSIAWEFRSTYALEGFEIYELQSNGDYLFHAEYASTDQFRTVIDGKIWPKT